MNILYILTSWLNLDCFARVPRSRNDDGGGWIASVASHTRNDDSGRTCPCLAKFLERRKIESFSKFLEKEENLSEQTCSRLIFRLSLMLCSDF